MDDCEFSDSTPCTAVHANGRPSWQKHEGSVVTVPPTFCNVQIDALEQAATDASVKVYQFLEGAGAVVVTTS